MIFSIKANNPALEFCPRVRLLDFNLQSHHNISCVSTVLPGGAEFAFPNYAVRLIQNNLDLSKTYCSINQLAIKQLKLELVMQKPKSQS